VKEKEKKCNCTPECECGCQDGKDCTCGCECECGCGEGKECTCEGECKENKKDKKHESHHDHKNHEKLEKLENELAQEKEKTLRIQAEMMNFKRRSEETMATFKKYANEDILKELLAVQDNFERGLMLESDENKELLKGFRMIYQNIGKILEENGVTEIVAENVEFDPNVHQAVMTGKVDGVAPGMVIQVLQKGYKYKERVLRPAMVKVSE